MIDFYSVKAQTYLTEIYLNRTRYWQHLKVTRKDLLQTNEKNAPQTGKRTSWMRNRFAKVTGRSVIKQPASTQRCSATYASEAHTGEQADALHTSVSGTRKSPSAGEDAGRGCSRPRRDLLQSQPAGPDTCQGHAAVSPFPSWVHIPFRGRLLQPRSGRRATRGATKHLGRP